MNAAECDTTRDGWCATHSTAESPVYCLTPKVLTQLRRARFHENENYWRAVEAEAKAERYRLAWQSARRRGAWRIAALAASGAVQEWRDRCYRAEQERDIANTHLRALRGDQ